MDDHKSSPFSGLTNFAIKALIVMVVATTIANIVTPDLTSLVYGLRKAAKDEKTRILLTSFIQNPAALYKAAEIDEKNGRVADAIMEMELAIGLLQMHNSSPNLIEKYESRLAEMKKHRTSSTATQKPKSDGESMMSQPIKRWERN